MKNRTVRICFAVAASLGALTLLTFIGQPAVAEEEAAPQYIGAVTCAKICHKTAKQGEQLSLWQASSHAKAFETLASAEAKKIGAKMGIADPQKADACLTCHLTGHGAAAEAFGSKYTADEGVGCEACHGAGSLYKKRSLMKNREAAVGAGLVVPTEATCKECHNEKSPTYKAFDYEEMVKKIAHAKPAAPKG
jgi:hypothetical protein